MSRQHVEASPSCCFKYARRLHVALERRICLVVEHQKIAGLMKSTVRQSVADSRARAALSASQAA